MFTALGLTIAEVGVKIGKRTIYYASRDGVDKHVSIAELAKTETESTSQFFLELSKGWWYPWGSSQARTIKDFT